MRKKNTQIKTTIAETYIVGCRGASQLGGP